MLAFFKQVDRESWALSDYYGYLIVTHILEFMAGYPQQKWELGNWLIDNKGAIGTGSLML